MSMIFHAWLSHLKQTNVMVSLSIHIPYHHFFGLNIYWCTSVKPKPAISYMPSLFDATFF